MRIILSFILLVLFTSTKAQIDFSYQANGSVVTFSITQMGQFYEGIKWDFGDGTIDYGQTVNHIYFTSGNFSVCVIGYSQPISTPDTMCKSVPMLVTLISDNQLGNEIKYYPNPVKDQLNLIMSSQAKNGKLELTDIQGRVLLSQNTTDLLSAIDMKSFSPGLYFVKIQNHSETSVFKIVKD